LRLRSLSGEGFFHRKTVREQVLRQRILQKYLDGVKSYYGESREDLCKYLDWIKSCHGVEMAEWFDELVDNAESNGVIEFDW